MSHSWRSCLAGILGPALLAVAPVQAQHAPTARYALERWDTDAGLPQTSVNAILQTADGYLWLGTLGGVARFDGTAFTSISTGDRTGLRSDRIAALAQDRAGRVWIGTEHGLSRYERGVITTLTSEDGLPGNNIRAVAAHPNGAVFFYTGNHAIGRVDEQGLRMLVLPGSELGALEDLAVDSAGTIWVSAQSGVWRMDAVTGAAMHVRRHTRNLSRVVLTTDERDGVWMTTDSGVSHVTQRGVREYAIHREPGFALDRVATLAQGGGDLWIGLSGMEIWRFRADTISGAHQLQQVKPAEPGNISSLLVDREGSVWAGNRIGGLTRMRVPILTTLTTADGLAADNLHSVFADSRGRVWIAGQCAVSLLDGATVRTIVAPGFGHCVGSVGEDTTGAIWFGGNAVGRWRDGVAEWFDDVPGAPSARVRGVFRDHAGMMWFGDASGITSWDGTRFQQHAGRGDVVLQNVQTIQQTRDHALWVLTQRGAARYAEGTLRLFTTVDGLPHDNVRALYEDETGVLWLATYGGGLARYHGGTFHTITTADGLPDNYLSSITADEAGNLWLSGNRGVFRVRRSQLEDLVAGRVDRVRAVVYGRTDGMVSAETNGGFQPSVTRTADGRLWYPTLIGVASIDPAYALMDVAPTASVESVRVNGRLLDAADVSIGPGTINVQFTYAGLSLVAPHAVTFRYQLQGWDEDWIDAGAQRTAYYSRLRPGSYRFRVMASNRDGAWAEAAAPFAFTVLPAFWQTWWFRMCTVLIAASLARAGYGTRLRQVRHRTEEREREAARQRVTQILESVTNGFVALDGAWCFTYVNRTAEALLHHPRSELIGRSFWDCFPRARATVIEEELRHVAANGLATTFEAPDSPTYGRWLEIHAAPSDDGLSLYFSDVTSRKEAEAALRSQSLRDELTGVFNRRGFIAHAEQLMVTSHRSGVGFHIVFIDMDGMKAINDTHGHPAGDRALLDTVELMLRTFRESDIVGRLGGDEFAVIVSDLPDGDIEAVCERLRDTLRTHNDAAGRPFTLSLSLGTSYYDPINPAPIADLIDEADQRMYEQKRARGSARVPDGGAPPGSVVHRRN